MLIARGVIGLILLGLWLYCVLDVITTPGTDVRNMPKPLWLFVVILLPTVGSVLWLIAGRPRRDQSPRARPANPTQPKVVSPDDDEEFLRRLNERAEEQRRAAREREKREEPGDSE